MDLLKILYRGCLYRFNGGAPRLYQVLTEAQQNFLPTSEKLIEAFHNDYGDNSIDAVLHSNRVALGSLISQFIYSWLEGFDIEQVDQQSFKLRESCGPTSDCLYELAMTDNEFQRGRCCMNDHNDVLEILYIGKHTAALLKFHVGSC